MTKKFYHISITIFSFFFFLHVRAQDTAIVVSPPAEMADSVYETSNNMYHFKEVTAAEKVDVRTISGNDLQKIKSDDEYWYANLAPAREKKKQSSAEKPAGIFDKAWFKTLFWTILIAVFVALLIWFLASSNISLFRKRIQNAGDRASEEAETENIFEINFEKEIQKAIDASDYRLAVRLMYLKTLKQLSLRNIINYTHKKTNSDYLFQLAGSSYYKNFFRLTRHFDYTWYGHFPLSQESFSVIQDDFNNFKQQLS
jgi:hypothetical protein